VKSLRRDILVPKAKIPEVKIPGVKPSTKKKSNTATKKRPKRTTRLPEHLRGQILDMKKIESVFNEKL
jgi:hypothetical protein